MNTTALSVFIFVAVLAAYTLGYRAGAGPQPKPAQLPVNTGWVAA